MFVATDCETTPTLDVHLQPPQESILALHDRISHQLQAQQQLLPQLQQEEAALKRVCASSSNQNLRARLVDELDLLAARIDDIQLSKTYNTYLAQTLPLIHAYKAELNKPIKLDFFASSQDTSTSIDTERKTALARQFLRVAQRYAQYTASAVIDITQCPNCTEQPLNDPSASSPSNIVADINNVLVCTHCGLRLDISQSAFSYKDNDRINVMTKYTYVRRIHFRDCINQFQGKQHSIIPQSVYDTLYTQIRNYKLETEDAETLQERYHMVTKVHIMTFLKQASLSKHYENANLIFKTITGNVLDDISHLEDVLLEDFDTLNELYERMYIQTNQIQRKNFINTQYVLYQLLRRHRYPCDPASFNFLKTTERQQFHDSICAKLFDELGWEFKPVFF